MSARTMATWAADTLRRPAVTAGRVGAAVTNLTGVAICPLMPVTPEVVNLYQIESPRETKLTYAFAERPACGSGYEMPDIREGDVLVTRGQEFIIRSVGEWQRDEQSDYLELIVEEQK